MRRVPEHVVADVEVEVAVVVEVGERRRGRIVARPSSPARSRHVLERAVAAVAVERVGLQAGHEEVGMPVVVVIADGDAHGRSLDPRRSRRSRTDSVTSSKVPSPRLRKSRSPGRGSPAPCIRHLVRRSTTRPVHSRRRASRRRRSRAGPRPPTSSRAAGARGVWPLSNEKRRPTSSASSTNSGVDDEVPLAEAMTDDRVSRPCDAGSAGGPPGDRRARSDCDVPLRQSGGIGR